MKFRVNREHTADKSYVEGDTREAAMADVQHLVPRVLTPLADAKADTPSLNKAEPATANKAEASRKAK